MLQLLSPLIRRKRVQPGPPARTPLALVTATYSPTPSPVLTLVFDSAIDLAGYNGAELTLTDGNTSKQYTGGTATKVNPVTAQIPLVGGTTITATGVHLTATNANGILAAKGGGSWSGCTNRPMD
jgi:hypothetical protein